MIPDGWLGTLRKWLEDRLVHDHWCRWNGVVRRLVFGPLRHLEDALEQRRR